MHSLLSSLLLYPFEKNQMSWPEVDQNILFWGADYFSDITKIKNSNIVQNFKPFADNLESAGIRSIPEVLDDAIYDFILCVIPKQKEAALYQLSKGVTKLTNGGCIMAVASNDAGGKRLEKWFKEIGLSPQSLSKSKCRIVWAMAKDKNHDQIQNFLKNGGQQDFLLSDGYRFVTKPGIFGWNKIDTGSKLLLETMSDDLKGVGADFGCGYGYLSQSILQKFNIKKLYAIDADYDALKCCKENLSSFDNVEFLREDLTKPQKFSVPLDWVVMNPPFHDQKETNLDVGMNFINGAARSLRNKGTLYMVANAHLAYEGLLGKTFTNVDKVIEEQGFKVFKAIK